MFARINNLDSPGLPDKSCLKKDIFYSIFRRRTACLSHRNRFSSMFLFYGKEGIKTSIFEFVRIVVL